MVFKIRPFAEYDMAETMNWYELQRPGLEIEFLNEVEKAFDFIRENPFANAVRYKRKGISIRFAILHRFPYTIVYFIDDLKDRIVIEAIWHASRSPKKWRSRL